MLRVLGVFVTWQLALMRFMPGASYAGPATATGHTPRYVENGPVCFVLTLLAYFCLSTWGVGALLPAAMRFSPAILFDVYPSLVSFLSIAVLIFCCMLTVKGRTCPSGRDSGSTGNFVLDLYWGTELYPRIFGWDVKQFTNCR